MPKKKDFPKNPSLELQRDLLIHPENNATRYVPFEDAAAHEFKPEAAAWSRVNAWWLADASWIAYSHDAAGVREVFRDSAGMTSCQLIAGGGTECYLAHRDSFAIVVFRGTQPDDWNDLFNISQFVPTAWDVGHVHQGFAAALERVWPQLTAALDRLPSNCRLWLTGHSLGAALASLAAVRRAASVDGLYTFGAPRVGDGAFAGHVSRVFVDRSIRYVNDHDGVTHVPPPAFAFPGRYTHADSLRWINKDGQVGTTEPTVAHFMADVFGDPRVLGDILGASRQGVRIALPDTLTDHTPLYYALHTWNDFAVNGEVRPT